jgi:hypothetical protein
MDADAVLNTSAQLAQTLQPLKGVSDKVRSLSACLLCCAMLCSVLFCFVLLLSYLCSLKIDRTVLSTGVHYSHAATCYAMHRHLS